MKLNAAGHSILHELTHLDSLGEQAGLGAPTTGDDQGRHGTDDAQTGCELLGARDWLTRYQTDNSLTSPDYNAESYAAAATGKTSIGSELYCTPNAHHFYRALFHEPL